MQFSIEQIDPAFREAVIFTLYGQVTCPAWIPDQMKLRISLTASAVATYLGKRSLII